MKMSVMVGVMIRRLAMKMYAIAEMMMRRTMIKMSMMAKVMMLAMKMYAMEKMMRRTTMMKMAGLMMRRLAMEISVKVEVADLLLIALVSGSGRKNLSLTW